MIPQISVIKQNSSWQQELKDSISCIDKLINILKINKSQLPPYLLKAGHFPLKVPQSFISRMRINDPLDPLLRQILPENAEAKTYPGFSRDALQEDKYNPLPGVLHKYYGRVLIMLTSACAVHCRYCFRQNFPYANNIPGLKGLDKILNYLKENPEVFEVILSGGDPLMVNDEYLNTFIEKIVTLPQVTTLRIHTRLPIVIPNRITPRLIEILTPSTLKTVLVLHANHPNEIDDSVRLALKPLKQAGVTLLSQTVLLKGINDRVEILEGLSHALFKAGIMPYYLHILDKVQGSGHFEVSLKEAQILASQLLGRLPGYLVPKLVQELPGKNAKTPVPLHASEDLSADANQLESIS